jgi:hypothetical protein
MQLDPKVAACFTPVHGFTDCGAFHRRAPTGGAANGMPLNDNDTVRGYTCNTAASHIGFADLGSYCRNEQSGGRDKSRGSQ